MRNSLLLAATAIALTATPVSAQNTSTSVRDRIGQILGNLLGVGNQADNSLEGQWTANRRPLGDQRFQFESRVDSDVRSNLLTQATGARLKSDYDALTQLEAQYGTDGTFTTSERTELTTRYNALLQVLADRRYPDSATTPTSAVADGQSAFNARVDAQVTKRRITRTTATRLKADYAAIVKIESDYLRDGVLSDTERDDLDNRLDALDVRVGDVAYQVPVTSKTRLDAIATAIPKSGLSLALRNQLLVEYGDLARLEAAYARLTPTADEKAYLERRLTNLELRAKVVK